MTIMRQVLFLILFATPGFLWGHIGSSTVVAQGTAGPYPIRVVIRPPDVIPGLAAIDIRFLDAVPAETRVLILPVNSTHGLKSAPTPDETQKVSGDATLRHGDLWLMTTGAYSVHVDISGPRGDGKFIVPFEAIARKSLPVPPWLGGLLLGMGGLLLASGIVIASSGVLQSIATTGQATHRFRRTATYLSATVTLILFASTGVWLKRWWGYEDWVYRNKMIYQPQLLQTKVSSDGDQPMVELTIKPNANDPGAPLPLLPDHGKFMHLFAVREPALDVFAHLHPYQAKPGVFQLSPPPLPPGKYRLYADVTFEDGFATTLTSTLELPAVPPTAAAKTIRPADPDDSWWVATATPAGAEAVRLESLNPDKLHAGEPVLLLFRATDQKQQSLGIELYMGMFGHAAVRRDDGSVFAHVHPSGTTSMAAQRVFETQAGLPATGAHAHMSPAIEICTTGISFPYEFPVPGNYRVWVQAKVNKVVHTAPFDFTVLPKK